MVESLIKSQQFIVLAEEVVTEERLLFCHWIGGGKLVESISVGHTIKKVGVAEKKRSLLLERKLL